MQFYKEVVVPETLVQQYDCMTCDICGKKSVRRDWGSGNFQVAETTIAIQEGVSYPEHQNTVTHSYDVCVECFKGILMPYLATFGAKPTVTESE